MLEGIDLIYGLIWLKQITHCVAFGGTWFVPDVEDPPPESRGDVAVGKLHGL